MFNSRNRNDSVMFPLQPCGHPVCFYNPACPREIDKDLQLPFLSEELKPIINHIRIRHRDPKFTIELLAIEMNCSLSKLERLFFSELGF
jgi:hypothetical protein